jgi:hypothetical protein
MEGGNVREARQSRVGGGRKPMLGDLVIVRRRARFIQYYTLSLPTIARIGSQLSSKSPKQKLHTEDTSLAKSDESVLYPPRGENSCNMRLLSRYAVSIPGSLPVVLGRDDSVAMSRS